MNKPQYIAKDTSVTAVNVTYQSYLLNDGNGSKWLIEKTDTTAGVVKTYTKGDDDYSTAWTGRDGLVYIDEIVFDGSFF